jgi:hypothetical protein
MFLLISFQDEAPFSSAPFGVLFGDFKNEQAGFYIPSQKPDLPASGTLAHDFDSPRIQMLRPLRTGTGKIMEVPVLPVEIQNRAERCRPAIFRNRVERQHLSGRVILDPHREGLRADAPGER